MRQPGVAFRRRAALGEAIARLICIIALLASSSPCPAKYQQPEMPRLPPSSWPRLTRSIANGAKIARRAAISAETLAHAHREFGGIELASERCQRAK
jgi:hypothetical protein